VGGPVGGVAGVTAASTHGLSLCQVDVLRGWLVTRRTVDEACTMVSGR